MAQEVNYTFTAVKTPLATGCVNVKLGHIKLTA